jgi:hypothetical protein
MPCLAGWFAEKVFFSRYFAQRLELMKSEEIQSNWF